MNYLLSLLEGRRVAIVGNGNVKEDLSKEVDSADVVVRFNHFYNYDSGRVGRRVDVVMQTITPMYFEAKDRHDDVVRAQRPVVFLVKNHFTYDTRIHVVYGSDVRVENATRLFGAYGPFTTGTTVLAYLSEKLENAEVRCYGFQDEEDWNRYLKTDAKGYNVQPFEREVMMKSIGILESLKITEPPKETRRAVVVPVKRNSTGVPGKNRLLLDRCLAEAKRAGFPISVIGDDDELLHKAHAEHGVDITPLPSIDAFADVTDSLREWRARSGFFGEVALVQCTSPRMRHEWISEAFKGLEFAPVAATATRLGFKASAIYVKEGNVFVRACQTLPPTSVARQRLPETVRVNGAVVAVHTDAFDFPSIFDAGVLRPVLVSEEDSLDVDVREDLVKAGLA